MAIGNSKRKTLSVKRKNRRLMSIRNHKNRLLAIETVSETENNKLQEIPANNVEDSILEPNMNASDKIMNGRRIIELSYFFEEIKKIQHCDLFSCTISNLHIIKERKCGFLSTFIIKCNMCNVEKEIKSESNENMDINTAAVNAMTITGGSFALLSEMSSALDIPCMSSDLFLKQQEKLSEIYKESAWDSMEKAGIEEATLAREGGDVDKNGTPTITVIADGAWSKRSYRTNYDSLSGVACIIGQRTGKLLFLGIRNKYCCICEKSKHRGEITKNMKEKLNAFYFNHLLPEIINPKLNK